MVARRAMLNYDPDHDAYAILGVEPEASPEEIEAAYRKAARVWHPDKSPAPDAADRFQELRQAADILRDKHRRTQYDRLRKIHLGRHAAQGRSTKTREPRTDAPMKPPPAWLAERVRIHFDAVIFNLKIPTLPTTQGRWMDLIGFSFLVIAIAARDIKFAALALVCLFIARVLSTPPHDGILAWAKVIPGRRVAEYHALDRRVDRYETWTVPYSRLGVAIIGDRGQWRIKVTGFPNAEAPELANTRDLSEARRLAREAGTWLRLPLRDVA